VVVVEAVTAEEVAPNPAALLVQKEVLAVVVATEEDLVAKNPSAHLPICSVLAA